MKKNMLILLIAMSMTTVAFAAETRIEELEKKVKDTQQKFNGFKLDDRSTEFWKDVEVSINGEDFLRFSQFGLNDCSAEATLKVLISFVAIRNDKESDGSLASFIESMKKVKSDLKKAEKELEEAQEQVNKLEAANTQIRKLLAIIKREQAKIQLFVDQVEAPEDESVLKDALDIVMGKGFLLIEEVVAAESRITQGNIEKAQKRKKLLEGFVNLIRPQANIIEGQVLLEKLFNKAKQENINIDVEVNKADFKHKKIVAQFMQENVSIDFNIETEGLNLNFDLDSLSAEPVENAGNGCFPKPTIKNALIATVVAMLLIGESNAMRLKRLEMNEAARKQKKPMPSFISVFKQTSLDQFKTFKGLFDFTSKKKEVIVAE
ncbi:hypothetical protein JKY79_02135 [Candidatus Babeliales bacterium]|nr:hypothetical protein [Candidatus Babeliales bacterium]